MKMCSVSPRFCQDTATREVITKSSAVSLCAQSHKRDSSRHGPLAVCGLGGTRARLPPVTRYLKCRMSLGEAPKQRALLIVVHSWEIRVCWQHRDTARLQAEVIVSRVLSSVGVQGACGSHVRCRAEPHCVSQCTSHPGLLSTRCRLHPSVIVATRKALTESQTLPKRPSSL